MHFNLFSLHQSSSHFLPLKFDPTATILKLCVRSGNFSNGEKKKKTQKGKQFFFIHLGSQYFLWSMSFFFLVIFFIDRVLAKLNFSWHFKKTNLQGYSVAKVERENITNSIFDMNITLILIQYNFK